MVLCKYGFIAAGTGQQKQPEWLFLAINENSAMPNLGRKLSSKRSEKSDAALLKQNSVYFLKTETKKQIFANDNFKNNFNESRKLFKK